MKICCPKLMCNSQLEDQQVALNEWMNESVYSPKLEIFYKWEQCLS